MNSTSCKAPASSTSSNSSNNNQEVYSPYLDEMRFDFNGELVPKSHYS
ncbi:unnamed protein product, partial [Amoebophrya sp. A25]|eukprot:GSA25T00018904001.1